MAGRLTVISFYLALAASALLLVLPGYSGSIGGQARQATLLDVNGSWALVPLSFPPVLLLIPLAFAKRALRVTACVVLFAFVVASGFTVGLFYLPAAVLLLLAATHKSPT
jgi:hypothetical protein